MLRRDDECFSGKKSPSAPEVIAHLYSINRLIDPGDPGNKRVKSELISMAGATLLHQLRRWSCIIECRSIQFVSGSPAVRSSMVIRPSEICNSRARVYTRGGKTIPFPLGSVEKKEPISLDGCIMHVMAHYSFNGLKGFLCSAHYASL